MSHVWLAYSLLMLTITICSMFNKSLFTHLDILIPWLSQTFHPILIRVSPGQARDINIKQIPELEEWLTACEWYAILTYILLVLLLILGALLAVNNGIPYILLMVIGMLLGSTVFFFPRTVIRWIKVKKAIGHYFLAYAGLIEEIKEKSNDGHNTSN